jgi:hypothetical protein
MPIYKVLFKGKYYDMKTYYGTVEASNDIEAAFLFEDAFECFGEDYYDFNTGELIREKLPKTFDELEKIAWDQHNYDVEVKLIN